VGTEAATLAGYRVNPEIFNRIKTAKVLAQATLSASALVYLSYLAAPKLVLLSHGRAEQQMEVSSIHIAVGKHLPFRQGSEGAHDTGLPGASFTA